MMESWIAGLITACGVPLLLYIWGMLMSRKRTRKWGYGLGRFLTVFGRQRVGVKGWEKLEDRVQSTVADFIEGMNAGLDSDEGIGAQN